jgi:hypothetical protein
VTRAVADPLTTTTGIALLGGALAGAGVRVRLGVGVRVVGEDGWWVSVEWPLALSLSLWLWLSLQSLRRR